MKKGVRSHWSISLMSLKKNRFRKKLGKIRGQKSSEGGDDSYFKDMTLNKFREGNI